MEQVIMEPVELLNLLSEPYPLLRIRSEVDRLPIGLAAAMAPAIVDWRRSMLEDDQEGFYLVHNVNVGGNPVEGRTVLATVKIPRAGVIAADWVLVLKRILGKDTAAGHGQLRLRFHEDKQPTVLNRDGGPMWPDPHVEDLVFSFEAWRPPGTSFNPRAGLDPNTYALTMRCYAGPQRFLEDGVCNHSWAVYPLDLDRHYDAFNNLLYTALVTGDSLARHTINHLLEKPAVHLDLEPTDYPQIDPRQIEELRPLLDRDQVPEDPIAQITGGLISYHLLQRSCITMGLNVIDTSLHRLHHRYPELGTYESLPVAPKKIPSWISNLAHSDRRATLLRLPGAIHWLAVHQTVLPDRSQVILKNAGLLRTGADGQVVSHYYFLGGDTPYGRISDSLMQ